MVLLVPVSVLEVVQQAAVLQLVFPRLLEAGWFLLFFLVQVVFLVVVQQVVLLVVFLRSLFFRLHFLEHVYPDVTNELCTS